MGHIPRYRSDNIYVRVQAQYVRSTPKSQAFSAAAMHGILYGLPRLIDMKASKLAAQKHVPPEGHSPGIQPLQSVVTRCWKSVTTSAMRPAATIPTTQG